MTSPTTVVSTATSPNGHLDRHWFGFGLRAAITAILVGGYYWVRGPLGELAGSWYARVAGKTLDVGTPRIIVVIVLLALLVLVWRKLVLHDPRFHAPLLITAILAIGDAAFNILENLPAPPWLTTLTGGVILEYSPTFMAIVATILAEIVLGRFFWGKWPHLASAYISGISVGILIKSSELWPFVLCGLISIMSKYVLRIGQRHLWNPTNFGVTMMLFLAPAHVASLSVQAGNNGLAVLVIWVLGLMIMYRLGRFHVPLAFVAAFIPLAFLRSYVTGHPWQTELAPITSPMFQLYIFFMITDPKTTTRGWRRQMLVAVLVAVMETALRLAFKDVHSLYHALFTVAPAANLIEIYWDRRQQVVRTRSQP
ncbi:MAG: rsxD [Planctomycetaceae bacterium]|nr:rsxD [Planctomycetaceae bacterium]